MRGEKDGQASSNNDNDDNMKTRETRASSHKYDSKSEGAKSQNSSFAEVEKTENAPEGPSLPNFDKTI